MKTLIISLLFMLFCSVIYPQNITNTLGSSGIFTIKDASGNYLTLSQSTGQVNILKTLRLENTTSSSLGIIFKGTNSFLHVYKASGSDGFNTFLGINAGNFTMSGSGVYASYNTAIGYLCLNNNTNGFRNTALGYSALFSNSTGGDNTSVGNESLTANTTGYNNTALGNGSLYSNTTGYNNTALGDVSLATNTLGNYNTAVGLASMNINSTGSYNTALGVNSLYANGTGNSNTAIGSYSLYNNTASSNTAVGDSSL